MTTFHLTVVTPDGCAFDGQAERIVCRAIDGDLAILAKHGDYCTALGMGEAHIVDADGQRRRKNLNDREYELAQARLKRALVRTSVH